MTEFEYIAWLRGHTPDASSVLTGPGDDCAVLKPTQHPMLVTTDMLLEGSHFLLAEAGPRRVGRKAMAVNLSDIAAMAGTPTAAVVSVALPRNGPAGLAQELFFGLREMADRFVAQIVGGDTNVWAGDLAISVTLFGEAPVTGAVLRSGAKPGDWLFVTGPLGGSILGKHIDFEPRVREARQLVQLVPIHAMIDISDGLAAELHHLCEESGCGAQLLAEHVPVAAAAGRMADGLSPFEHALGDGEDFELLFAVSPEDGARLLMDQPIPGMTLYHIGIFREGRAVEIVERGETRSLARKGYEHKL